MTSLLILARTLILSAVAVIGFSANAALAHPRGHELNAQDNHSKETELSIVDDQLAQLRERRDAAPTDVDIAVAYARYAAKKARRIGDAVLLRHAERALQHWEVDMRAPTEILVIRANIKQINHRFTDALADLDTVLAREPGNPQALLSRAFIRATTGDAKSGLDDCASLRPNVSLTIREACAARLGGLSGNLGASHRRMQAVLEITPSSRVQERVFALAVAAELAERINDTDRAEAYYSELLSLDPVSVFARAAYADFLVSQKSFDEAHKIVGVAPHTEALLLISALAGIGTENAVSKNSATELGARMAADRLNKDFSHAREYARFALDYLKDPELALLFAQENWRVQKEPVDARILARAAISAEMPSALHSLQKWFDESGLEDPELESAFK